MATGTRSRAAAVVLAVAALALLVTLIWAAAVPGSYTSEIRMTASRGPVARYADQARSAAVAESAAGKLFKNLPDQHAVQVAAAELQEKVEVRVDKARRQIVLSARDSGPEHADRLARAYADALEGAAGRQFAVAQTPAPGSRPLVAIAIAAAIVALLATVGLFATRARRPRP
jgi:hypothetical protein